MMKFASLFSGCGGFDIGFLTSAFRSRGAYDCDPEAVENFAANVDRRIRQVDLVHGVPNERSLFGIDALIAGPPCQGFSTAGKRLLHDERNLLFKLTGSLALRIWPKVLVVENVCGLLAGQHSSYLASLDYMMRARGYRTHTMRCQAADLGMAQLRRRVLFFAWRTDREVPFDVPTHVPASLRSVLGGVNTQHNHEPKFLQVGSTDWRIANRIRPGQKLSNVRGGPNAVATWDIPEVFGPVSKHERTILEMLRRLRRQNRERNNGDADPVSMARLEEALGPRFRKLVEGLVTKGYLRRIDRDFDLVGTFNGKFRRLLWDKPSYTVDTRFGSPRYFLHPTEQRGFTVREAARIQGFDDSYVFYGSEKGQFRLIGNAVPPPLGVLAANITKRLLGKS
jgi:DNA (cytosine-5)-methyltransferase 1